MKTRLAAAGLVNFDMQRLNDPLVRSQVLSALKALEGPIRKVEPGTFSLFGCVCACASVCYVVLVAVCHSL